MKKIISFITKILTLGLVLIGAACEEKYTTFEGPYFVRFTTTSAAANEDAIVTNIIKLHAAVPKTTEDVEIQLTVTGGTAGVDFNFVEGGTTLTIPAGEYFTQFKITPIDNAVNDGPQVITFTIESVTGSNLDAGFGLVGKTFSYSIADDDCAIPSLEGTYLVYNRDASPSACGNPANDGLLTYEATITLVSENGDDKVYEISDITGGLYALCYPALGSPAGPNPGNIETNAFVITLTDQPDVVYGGDVFNGTGEMDCDGNFTLMWSNGFGDKGTSYYTRK